MNDFTKINSVLANPGPHYVVRQIVSGDCVALPSGNNRATLDGIAPNHTERETLDWPKGDPYEHISPSCIVIDYSRCRYCGGNQTYVTQESGGVAVQYCTSQTCNPKINIGDEQ